MKALTGSRYERHSEYEKCAVCGAPVAVEMNGPWSYRGCTRHGHVQPLGAGAGPLASAIMLYTARGQ